MRRSETESMTPGGLAVHDPPASTLPLEQQRSALGAYLRLLWNVTPILLRAPLPADERRPEPPFLSSLGLHLPAAPSALSREAVRDWYRASAAHAAAHLVYSRISFERDDLAPITQALIGVLEDARVESLACRELPGLRRLWLAWHRAGRADGDDAETLLLRLARGLLDPGYDDPHPWVQKGRGLLFHDARGEVLALRHAEELRHAASLLGNDIGQMRLGFNPRLYRPGPSYRDDNRWLWRAAPQASVEARSIALGMAEDRSPPDARPAGEVLRHYPEWDRLIERLRPAWCSAREVAARPCHAAPGAAAAADEALKPALLRVLRQARAAQRAAAPRQCDGDDIDLQAMIDARLACRLGQPADERVYRRVLHSLDDVSVMLLIDGSASTALPFDGVASRLDIARRIAALLAETMVRAGYRIAIQGFASNGRQQVHFERVKDFDEPWNEVGAARLAGLRSRLSTRLGTALRHGRQALSTQISRRRLILVITDGEPHDVDVHDPRYLAHDARHAVHAAARDGIAAACLGLDAGGVAVTRMIFGSRRCQSLGAIENLPQALRRLLA